MTLINLTVSSVNRSLVPWTVIQVETGLTFSELFAKLLAGSSPNDKRVRNLNRTDEVHNTEF